MLDDPIMGHNPAADTKSCFWFQLHRINTACNESYLPPYIIAVKLPFFSTQYPNLSPIEHQAYIHISARAKPAIATVPLTPPLLLTSLSRESALRVCLLEDAVYVARVSDSQRQNANIPRS